MSAALVRPMREDDLAALADITATSYYEVDVRTYQRAWPDPVRRPPARNGAWIARTHRTTAADSFSTACASSASSLGGRPPPFPPIATSTSARRACAAASARRCSTMLSTSGRTSISARFASSGVKVRGDTPV